MIYKLTQPNRNIARALILAVVVYLGVSAAAVQAVSISQDYSGSQSSIKAGSLVALRKEDPTTIEPLNVDNKDYALGIVVEQGRTLLNFQLSATDNVAVATSGEVLALASDINGEIKKGDFVGASYISGVAMKVDEQSASKQRLIGVALADFDASKSQTINNGALPSDTKTVKISYMPISIVNKDREATLSDTKSTLESLGGRLAGKDVSLAKVLSALAIFSLVVMVAAMVIVGSVKGSFVSVGRNPMASNSIQRSLVKVSILSVVAILIGAALAYLVLAV